MDEGADLVEVDGDYDAAVAAAVRFATDRRDTVLVQDMAWEDYTDIPQWIAPTFIEWADAVLFAWREADGSRVLTTEGTSTVTAKNRYALPPRLELSWDAVAAAIQREPAPSSAAPAASD